jgi:hypothetical protein
MVEYLADPEAVAQLLPTALEAGERPGLAAAIFGDWQSCTDEASELLDPVRSQYREFYIALAARWQGKAVARCPFCWVDKDFSLIRGLIQGYPKKLGSIAVTRAFGIGRATPRLSAGAAYAGTLASADRRLVEARVTLTAPAPPPTLMLAPLVHTRCFPSWDPTAADLDELVISGSTDQHIDNVWAGDAELEIFDSPHDELSLLRPVQILRGYRFSFAETITAGRRVSASGR